MGAWHAPAGARGPPRWQRQWRPMAANSVTPPFHPQARNQRIKDIPGMQYCVWREIANAGTATRWGTNGCPSMAWPSMPLAVSLSAARPTARSSLRTVATPMSGRWRSTARAMGAGSGSRLRRPVGPCARHRRRRLRHRRYQGTAGRHGARGRGHLDGEACRRYRSPTRGAADRNAGGRLRNRGGGVRHHPLPHRCHEGRARRHQPRRRGCRGDQAHHPIVAHGPGRPGPGPTITTAAAVGSASAVFASAAGRPSAVGAAIGSGVGAAGHGRGGDGAQGRI